MIAIKGNAAIALSNCRRKACSAGGTFRQCPLDTGQLQLPSLQGDLNGHYEWQANRTILTLRAGLEIRQAIPVTVTRVRFHWHQGGDL
ncbi:hypothetical protein JOY44_24550 (plasmid) [Phormidium sp. CLA17]|uniref:hypothetical protein n=1 Tax=Leptolyngbya sp. Cla-17 TaxID=2803751 RepID=UPI001490AE9F|nr:hypothetical protein [Leptolyngbya sp. Cla-17]MBM0744731.1 hypothetical protein [Leptolyngbya sp. Cla-17]